jgi:predicted HTH domain antitoxin
MRLELLDEIVNRAEATEADLLLALAIQFYADNRIDHTDACRLAGVPAAVFNRELLERALGVQQYPAFGLGRIGRRKAV